MNAPNQSKTKINAFTLAEVLITLAIIGIVAALTIPSVLRNYKANVMEAAFKKGYSAIIQMYNKTCIDNNLKYQDVVDLFTTEEGILKFREMFYKSNPNLDPTCFDRTNTKECATGSSVSYAGYKGVNKVYISNSWFERLPSGMTILFSGRSLTNPNTHYFVAIDTNGFKKGPNWAGHDVFFFQLDSKNRLVPRTKGGCSTTDSLSNQWGGGCAYYAVKNECPTDSNLNYWKCLY